MLNKNQKILLFILAFLLGWGWSFAAVRAADYGLKLSSSVTLDADSQTAAVKQVFSVAGADKTNLPATAAINVIGASPAGLSVAGPDGAKLTSRYDAEAGTISIDIPKNRRASAQAWSFSLSYRAEVLNQFGAVQAAQIPAVDSNLQITAQTTTVAADLDLGFASVRSLAPNKASIGVGQQILTFTNKGPQDKSLLVVFGEQTYAAVGFDITLKNNTWWWQDVGLTLPPDTNQQRVLLESIEPAPSRVKLDKDGNIVAYFKIGPLSSRGVKVAARMAIDNPTYQLDLAQPASTTDQLLIDRYTRLTDVWQPLGLDIELKDDATSADTAKAVFDGVVARAKEDMTARESFSLVPRASALKISDWLVGELRSRGLPARLVLGLAMSDGNRLSDSPRQHAWVEANLAGVGWVTLDPYQAVLSGVYGGADPLRIALALWGLEDDRPPVDLSQAEVEFIEEEPATPAIAGRMEITAKKYLVLPFVSVFNQSVKLSAGGIVDDVVLSGRRGQETLGSLAPYQRATIRSLVFGGSSVSAETITAQAGQDEDSKVETTATTSYLVLIAEAGLLLLIGLWWWWRKRTRQPKRRLKPSKESLTLHDEALGGSIEDENLVSSADGLEPVELDTPKAAPAGSSPRHPPPKLVQ